MLKNFKTNRNYFKTLGDFLLSQHQSPWRLAGVAHLIRVLRNIIDFSCNSCLSTGSDVFSANCYMFQEPSGSQSRVFLKYIPCYLCFPEQYKLDTCIMTLQWYLCSCICLPVNNTVLTWIHSLNCGYGWWVGEVKSSYMDFLTPPFFFFFNLLHCTGSPW